MAALSRTNSTSWSDAPLLTAPDVDLRRYMGAWHEIARLPLRYENRCVGQPRAHYALKPNGRVRVTNRCVDKHGREQVAVGEGRIGSGNDPAKLKVSFLPPLLRALPIGWADYWIVHVDADYRFAVVGEPRRRYCWLLSRESAPSPDDRERLMRIAAAQGFDVGRFIHH